MAISPQKRIFVFGSNLAGIHGKGAALRAKLHYGAVAGVAIGHIGNCYAIPTKDKLLRPLTLEEIRLYIDGFKAYAKAREDLNFNVTQVGCGLAGFKPENIAPLFHFSPSNCWFDPEWKKFLGTGGIKYWNGPL